MSHAGQENGSQKPKALPIWQAGKSQKTEKVMYNDRKLLPRKGGMMTEQYPQAQEYRAFFVDDGSEEKHFLTELRILEEPIDDLETKLYVFDQLKQTMSDEEALRLLFPTRVEKHSDFRDETILYLARMMMSAGLTRDFWIKNRENLTLESDSNNTLLNTNLVILKASLDSLFKLSQETIAQEALNWSSEENLPEAAK